MRLDIRRLGYANLDFVCPGEVFNLYRHCLLLSVCHACCFGMHDVFILLRHEVWHFALAD